ncbi:8baf18b7-203b-44ab-92c7-7395675baa57 [Thermothielavioides terrestris]|uniref:Inheritance of peroxisomes protein 1 n=1 Tax=Thermothielavioides terrestris TaxID=2587410 RepID=A0A446BTJ5_9PEZI|nr:8baf18b7-203b-44ab-92c7-7395675baa57 [Thermothielavioides terrestris]
MESPRPNSPGFAAPRRVFTAPVPPSAPQSAADSQAAGGLVDTLYHHPNVKIVSFTAATRSLSVGPRSAAAPDIEPGSLPWSTQLERTIAVGPFKIYRAPGSVAFLSCGSALQPIMPKSQAWCVDEESSKFVLQIRRPQYWRIEVPVAEEEDLHRAQQLRNVFDAILLFEKTACPFKRSFTVELPERPQTAVRKRPWTPVRRSSTSLPLTPVTPVEIARLHEGTPRGSICMGDLRTVGEARRALSEHARRLEPPAEEPTSKGNSQLCTGLHDDETPSASPVKSPRARGPMAPPHVPVIAAPNPKSREAGVNVPAEASRFKPPTESAESLQNPETWVSASLPPSPPFLTFSARSSPSNPPRHHIQQHLPIPPHPLPAAPAADLLTPRRASATAGRASADSGTSTNTTATARTTGTLAAVRRLPMTVIHKTCEILMSPPSHLISLMLNVAARIAAGEWRGLVFGMGETGERVSVTWDWSDGEFAGQQGRGRGRGRRIKMVGAFPESGDEEEDEQEEVGPLDVPRSARSKSPSAPALAGEMKQAAAESSAPTPADDDAETNNGQDPPPQRDADTDWGVD